MPRTPRRAGRRPRPGSRFLADILADNIRTIRNDRRLSQDDLAARMRDLGHQWIRATVSNVERGTRYVNVDELLGLAMNLDVTIGQLLSPRGAMQDRTEALDVGTGTPIRLHWAAAFAYSAARIAVTRGEDGRPNGWSITPEPGREDEGLALMAVEWEEER